MKSLSAPLAAVLGATLLLSAAPLRSAEERYGTERSFDVYTKIRVEDISGAPLGRIMGLAIDLANGRIVEVLVEADRSISRSTRIVELPPAALLPDQTNQVYRLTASKAVFESAPALDLLKLPVDERSAHLARVYRHFDHVPYFLEAGNAAPAAGESPKVALGHVTHLSRLLGLPVGNLKGEKLGKVWTVALDIPKGRILNVVIVAPNTFQTKRIVPALSLRFNAAGNALLLDDTVAEFADEPHYAYTEAANGQERLYKRESYRGPHTQLPLEQGTSYRDLELTASITREIRAAGLSRPEVEVGTNDGRVTLRGWVDTETDKSRIAEIAVAASRLELVDNQITVGRPLTKN
ncbi:MAG: BON domain-containing protein [Verrucomicrobia bacterium]|nr:BON domain-containing protein [Verrucomicrobiota bacterium]